MDERQPIEKCTRGRAWQRQLDREEAERRRTETPTVAYIIYRP